SHAPGLVHHPWSIQGLDEPAQVPAGGSFIIDDHDTQHGSARGGWRAKSSIVVENAGKREAPGARRSRISAGRGADRASSPGRRDGQQGFHPQAPVLHTTGSRSMTQTSTASQSTRPLQIDDITVIDNTK